jgi:hypothetical protein
LEGLARWSRRGRRLARLFLIVGGLTIVALMILEIVYFMAPALVGAGLKRQLSLTLYAPSGSMDAEDVAASLAKALSAGSHHVVLLASRRNVSISAAVLYSKGEPVLVIVAPLPTLKLIAEDRQLSSRLLDYALSTRHNETLVFIPGAGLEKIPRNETQIEQLVRSIVAG